jgi:hypothetical protein
MTRRAHLWLRAFALAFAVLSIVLAITWDEPSVPEAELSEGSVAILAPHPGVTALPEFFAATAPRPGGPGRAGDLPELLGVIGRLPDDAEVLVRSDEGASISLRVGQAISGWTLVAVSVDRAVFERGGERRILTIAPAGP